MEAVIFRSDDTQTLDCLVANFKPCPHLDADGVRIGTVLRIWREGTRIVADIECVPEDVKPAAR